MRSSIVGLLAFLLGSATAFAPRSQKNKAVLYTSSGGVLSGSAPTQLSMSDNNDNLEQKFGGYTAKQRLREEVESPFRTVRLFFFGSSTGSALTALYFSLLSAIKAYAGGFPDAPPLEEALQSCGINVAAAIVCGVLTYRDWKAGDANLARIAKGGALAKLIVTPADTSQKAVTLADYRRNSRVLIAAGGKDYINDLCLSLNADQLEDTNTIPTGLAASDVVVIPVLLKGDGTQVGDSMTCWQATTPDAEKDRNFDIARANQVVAFPRGNAAWAEYLKSEVETATKQGFDVLSKGFTITVKKNGRILRRATGLPPWNELIDTMEVLDGSKFGMPGDDEKYGS